MKISQKQASLLAREVLNKLKKQKVGEVPEVVVNQLRKYKEKRAELHAACKIHDEALRAHDATLVKLVGSAVGDKIYSTDTLDSMISKIRERDFPKLQAIEDEIILGAMFASDDDLQTFVNKIIKKFDKKTRSKVLSN